MKSKQSRALALAEHRKAHEKALTLIRNVRETWLDLYYWTEALRILQANRLLYKNLFKAGEQNNSFFSEASSLARNKILTNMFSADSTVLCK